ncbi:uncharacterized protein LOC133458036 [Cololabis saira]|uniref:uncharacterized protein LOC133458036 n=1 Tax=Cololabis saira TaxID=129043 RepID=UPI002AD588A7|nr:uncharacterized protein LOC133458036 [Cololabis saira]
MLLTFVIEIRIQSAICDLQTCNDNSNSLSCAVAKTAGPGTAGPETAGPGTAASEPAAGPFSNLVAEENTQRALDRAVRGERVSKRVFLQLSQSLSAQGYSRTAQQCRQQLEQLVSQYHEVKDHNSCPGSSSRTWTWLQQMDHIYGRRPSSNGRENGLDSASFRLETLPEDGGLSQSGACPAASLSSSSSSSPPARPASPTPSQLVIYPQQVMAGKRKRTSPTSELVDALQECNRNDQVLLAQRERHFQMRLADAREDREHQAALQREHQAALRELQDVQIQENERFNQGFLAALDRLVTALTGQRNGN